MANELQVVLGLNFNKVNAPKLKIEQTTNNITIAGATVYANTQSIGTGAHEALAIGADFGTAGYLYFENLDTTNYVEFGVEVAAAFYPIGKLKAGQKALLPVAIAVSAIFAKANTGAVNLFYAAVSV